MSKASDISDTILMRIRTGVYQRKIPGERSLAEEFQVDFKTANRAISQLVEQQILVRRRGEGTFVKPVDERRDLTISLCFHKYADLGRDPVFARFFAGMNSAALHHRVRLHVTTMQDVLAEPGLDEAQRLARFQSNALSVDPDGIIFLGNIDIPLIGRLRADRPVIVVGEVPASHGMDCVRRDIRGGTADAVRRFAAAGHRHIALLSYEHGDQAFDLIEKERGYHEAMQQLGLQPQHLSRSVPGDEDMVRRLQESSPRPSAVITTESTLGLGLIRSGPGMGLRIPQDLVIASFDDGDIGEFTQPHMSSIHAFGDELARLSVQRLIERLDGRTGRIDDVLPCTFVERR